MARAFRSASEAAEYRTLRRTLRGVWPSLPTLTVGSAAVCAGWVLTVLVAPGITPFSVVLAAFLVAPCTAALAAAGNRIARTGETTLRAWAGDLVSLWWFGTVQALPPAGATAAFLVALSVWRQSANPWWLPSVGLCGGCAVVTLLGLAAVLPLGAARPDLRGRALWICGLWLVAHHPLRFAAGVGLVVPGVWAATHWTASLLPLVPAPAVLVTVAAVWTSTARLGLPGAPEPPEPSDAPEPSTPEPSDAPGTTTRRTQDPGRRARTPHRTDPALRTRPPHPTPRRRTAEAAR